MVTATKSTLKAEGPRGGVLNGADYHNVVEEMCRKIAHHDVRAVKNIKRK